METSLTMIDLALVLVGLALLCWGLATYWQQRNGLPRGRVIYDDAGRKNSRTFFSPRYGLKGKPDYLIETDEGTVPVELKSGKAPANGRPHHSHLMQLAVYLLLLEEEFDEEPPYGVIRYQNQSMRVENSTALRKQLLAQLQVMRMAHAQAEVTRNHQQPQKCKACSYAQDCAERLA